VIGPLFLLLTVIPFLEFYLLYRVGNWTGFANTVALIIFSGILGAYFLKRQGHQILKEAQGQISLGKAPTKIILKGILTFIGGLLMLTPGFLTDTLGLSFVFPVTQLLWIQLLRHGFRKGIESGNVNVIFQGGHQDDHQGRAGHPAGGFESDSHSRDSARSKRFEADVIDINVKQRTSVEKNDKK